MARITASRIRWLLYRIPADNKLRLRDLADAAEMEGVAFGTDASSGMMLTGTVAQIATSLTSSDGESVTALTGVWRRPSARDYRLLRTPRVRGLSHRLSDAPGRRRGQA